MLKIWYSNNLFSFLLTPLSWVYRYLHHLKKTKALKNPYHSKAIVIVVGNITLGGSGKSPFVKYLLSYLSQRDFKVGVVSRGYKGSLEDKVTYIDNDSNYSAAEIGDEMAGLLRYSKQQNIPAIFAVGSDRVAATKLIEDQVEIIISDDGLQHYALARDFEIVLINGRHRFYNSKLLPSGPLREPLSRLKDVNLLVNNGGVAKNNEVSMELLPQSLIRLDRFFASDLNEQDNQLSRFSLDRTRVCAISALGDNSSFWDSLRRINLGLNVKVSLPDHQVIDQKLLEKIYRKNFLPIVITEKDAIKFNPQQLPELAEHIYVLEMGVTLKNIEAFDNCMQSIYQHIVYNRNLKLK